MTHYPIRRKIRPRIYLVYAADGFRHPVLQVFAVALFYYVLSHQVVHLLVYGLAAGIDLGLLV